MNLLKRPSLLNERVWLCSLLPELSPTRPVLLLSCGVFPTALQSALGGALAGKLRCPVCTRMYDGSERTRCSPSLSGRSLGLFQIHFVYLEGRAIKTNRKKLR